MFFTLTECTMRCAAIRESVSFIRTVCAGVTGCLIITHSDEVWQGGAESQGAARTGVVFSMYLSCTALVTFRVLLDTFLLIARLFSEEPGLSPQLMLVAVTAGGTS
jgi:hypothetical protein